MSNLTIATLPRISSQALAALVRTQPPTAPGTSGTTNSSDHPSPSLAIIDVRDHDHIGGHIRTSKHYPSATLDAHLPELLRTLADKDVVVFHCMLSQQRGPGAALRYARSREEAVCAGHLEGKAQKVVVLERGFEAWQQEYGRDETLTEGWRREIWEGEDE